MSLIRGHGGVQADGFDQSGDVQCGTHEVVPSTRLLSTFTAYFLIIAFIFSGYNQGKRSGRFGLGVKRSILALLTREYFAAFADLLLCSLQQRTPHRNSPFSKVIFKDVASLQLSPAKLALLACVTGFVNVYLIKRARFGVRLFFVLQFFLVMYWCLDEKFSLYL